MQHNILYNRGADGFIEGFNDGSAHERKLLFQRRRRDIHMKNPAINVAACGVAVHTGSHDIAPQICGALFIETRRDSVALKAFAYYVAEQLGFCFLHGYSMGVKRPLSTSHIL